MPNATVCRVLAIPDDLDFIACVTGALQTLTFADNWTVQGALTPNQCAAAMQIMFDFFCFQNQRCRVVAELIPYAGSVSPSYKFLICDGSSLLRSDYPDLFAIIGTAFGAADGTHFNIPDMRFRVAAGFDGTRPVGTQIGEETHTLIVGEMPSHTHSEGTAAPAVGAALLGVPIPSAVPAVGVTGSAGGDGAHNNIQPTLTITWLIVALP